MPQRTSTCNGRSRNERDELLQQRLPAGCCSLEFGAGLIEPLELLALLRLVEERVDQGIAGDRFQRAVVEAIVARGAEVFVGEIDAGDAGNRRSTAPPAR